MKNYVYGSTALVALIATVIHFGSASGAKAAPSPTTPPKGSQQLVLAGGCFWGMEAVFEQLKGVSSVVAGYSGGSSATAHYEIVSTGETGHAESVRITFDPSQISLDQLYDVFFHVAHDPTELNHQGADEGTQYRSAVFYTDADQKRVTEAYVAQLGRAKVFPDRIVTQIVPLPAFYPAEDYHQNYATRHPDNPYIVFNDAPKVAHLRQMFPDLYRGQ